MDKHCWSVIKLRSMKIVLVDFKWDYGSESRGINMISEFGFRRVFERLGHKCIPFYLDTLVTDGRQLQRELLAFSEDQKPDLIWFIPRQQEFEPSTLLELKKRYATVSWFGDDTWRFHDYSSKLSELFTYVVTTDPFSVAKYKALGRAKVFLSQWAAVELDGPAPSPSASHDYDVSFVGMANAVRRWYVKELMDRGFKVETFGHGWKNGSVKPEEMVRIFQRSRVNLNLSNSRSMDIRFFKSSWRSLANSLVTPKIHSQIKARNFEIPYSGGFQLTDYVPFLERYLRPGEEVACFDSIDGLESLLNFYLENSAEREKILHQGMARAHREHTFTHRLRDILSWVEAPNSAMHKSAPQPVK